MHGFKSYFPSSLYTPTAASAVADAKRGAAPFAAPVAGFAPSNFQHPAAGFMAASSQEHGTDYFLKGALAGGICCSVTHGALTPVDVVKTRMMLAAKTMSGDPFAGRGALRSLPTIVQEEGALALFSGLGPRVGWITAGERACA